ncbi:probable methyltransferase At1g27930 [Syzygium oleosum]|uniref:probable methyltransferase At1g27930 n=1 Tax=Syzygium oleosum TaxID=219896 RepID=UPI0024BBDD67|nr:probable methyltransferase At1g27930 [Syzygium oleosum]
MFDENNRVDMKKRHFDSDAKGRRHPLNRRWLLAVSAAFLVAAALLLLLAATAIVPGGGAASASSSTAAASLLRDLAGGRGGSSYDPTTPTQLQAILHYATSRVVPQQSLAEISLCFNVLRDAAPCNFLVFGLGHDSLMWAALNPHGTTVFLEEGESWIRSVLTKAPSLHAYHVQYPTRLDEADELLATYGNERDCMPGHAGLGSESRCRLALPGLPEEVREKQWDVIMIDAPRGYFAAAPGRMGAIFTAAVMARGRAGEGTTHVFLHDVNRRVERTYAKEFLCMKYKVEGTGRLWHFEIPPSDNVNATRFC